MPGPALALLDRHCLALRNGELSAPVGVVGPLSCARGAVGARARGVRGSLAAVGPHCCLRWARCAMGFGRHLMDCRPSDSACVAATGMGRAMACLVVSRLWEGILIPSLRVSGLLRNGEWSTLIVTRAVHLSFWRGRRVHGGLDAGARWRQWRATRNRVRHCLTCGHRASGSAQHVPGSRSLLLRVRETRCHCAFTPP